MQIYLASSGIQTYDPSVWGNEVISWLRQRSHCDRLCALWWQIMWNVSCWEVQSMLGHILFRKELSIVQIKEPWIASCHLCLRHFQRVFFSDYPTSCLLDSSNFRFLCVKTIVTIVGFIYNSTGNPLWHWLCIIKYNRKDLWRIVLK
jgi:hypothetical protein